MTAPPDDTTTDLHAVIAALQAERDAGLAREAALAEALAQCNSEFGERIEHQAATVDVLRVMSASPGDPQPVFDLIVERARDLCDAYCATVYEYDGTLIYFRAATGISDDATVREQVAAMYPMPPTRYSGAGRAILDRRINRIDDLEADTGLHPALRRQTAKSAVALPLLRGDVVVGALALGSRERGGFSDSQIELLKTFAEQAVIAITSAETHRALQERTAALAARNSEYGERIDQQAATIEVLKAMSASAGDEQPVLDLVARRARELCDAETVGIFSFDSDMISVRCVDALDPQNLEAYVSTFPRAPARDYSIGRAILDRRIIEIDDADADPNLTAVVHEHRHRSIITLPFVVDDRVAGGMSIGVRKPGGLTDPQKTLARTLAEQVSLAIGAAETYRALQTRTADLQQSLEYQTATSDVLKVISRSTFDLQPVLDTVVETAARLCDGEMAMIFRCEGELLRQIANFGFPSENERGPFRPEGPGVTLRALTEARAVHIHDVAAVPGYPAHATTLGRQRTSLGVPLMREGQTIGVILLARQRVEPFTDRQIELVSTFADQAVIAIENTRLLTEQREALEQQTATAEVLQVINASPGNLAPVFDAMLEKVMRLCGAHFGELHTFDGERLRPAALHGVPAALAEFRRRSAAISAPGPTTLRMRDGADVLHSADLKAEDAYRKGDPHRRALVDLGGARTVLAVALRRDDRLLGAINIYRQEVRPFSDRQVTLLRSFAAQAVIAMENARLLTETREALEQQTATAEVLQVINASPGDLTPVFDTLLERALHLCQSAFGTLSTYDGEFFHNVAFRGVTPELAEFLRKPLLPVPGSGLHKVFEGEDMLHTPDIVDDDAYRRGIPARRALADLGGARTQLLVALRKDGVLLGVLNIFRREVRPFTDKQIALLQNFAAQAVIAMENARLLNEIRQRQEELRITFENMGDGVALFDADLRLAAWNQNFQQIIELPDSILPQRPVYTDYLRLLAERGEFGAADVETELRRRIEDTDKELRLERVRPDGRVIEVRRNAVPGGGFVLIYSDITERKRSEEEIRAARDAAEAAYRDLKAAQANLIQAEKMASLGQLTAGIAHEIKNPLNFVNNFAELSVDLLGELKDAIAPAEPALTEKQRAEIEDVSTMLTSNLEKITEHGKRADGIVKAMLEHSRGSSSERRMVDLNVVIDEALNLAYHGARAQDQSFNITLERDFGQGIAQIEVNPQDMTRVFLNLFSNGFYAATRRARSDEDARFEPTLKVTTRNTGDAVEIRVRDNGTGIQADIRDKLFQPFFTTKPTGEGTGLGLSITYDIVTKAHGGSIAVDSKVGDYSEFTIRLPRNL